MASPLIPTPRVNKNGVTVIRHMRQESGKRAANIPPVTPPPAAPVSDDPATDLSDDKVLKLALGTHVKEWQYGDPHEVLDLIREDDAATIPLAVRLMCSGSPAARRIVKRVFVDIMTDIGEAARSKDEGWQENVTQWSPSSHLNLRRAWNCANVVTETGHPADAVQVVSDMFGMAGYDDLEVAYDLYREPDGGDSYWRGMTALTFIFEKDNRLGPESGRAGMDAFVR